MAQTIIPSGANLNSYTAGNGDVWNLQGNAILTNGTSASYAKALPSVLTIKGVSGGSTITLNDGAGHYGYFTGGAITLNLSDVTFTGGRGNTTGVINATTSLILDTTGSVAFLNNSSTSYGGAIRSAGALSISGDTLTLANNTATRGGAIYSGGTTTITATAIFITGNTLTGTGTIYGGGIYSVQDMQLSGAVTVSNNTIASGQGGGLYSAGALVIDGSLTGNHNTAGSGAVASGGGNLVTITGGVSLDGNLATTGQGGGISVYGALTASANLATVSGDVSLTNNTSARGGGAVYSSGSISIGNADAIVTISNNLGGFDSSGTLIDTASAGGALASQTVVSLTGRTITLANNKASNSGGAIVATRAVEATGDLILASNTSVQGNGGAIYASSYNTPDSVITVTGSLTAIGNTASGAGAPVSWEGRGGALYSFGGATVVTGSTFLQGNSSTNSGGAIYSNGGNISLATTTGNVTIIDNTTTGMGGAINDAAASSIMTIGNAGSTVLIGVDSAGLAAGNVATDAGGALYSGGTTTINGALINVSNNKTTGSASGGAI